MIRNYRQISRTDAAGLALGGSSCRAVRDKIKFRLNIVRFSVRDSISALTDSVTLNHDPSVPAFTVTDSMTLIQDSAELEVE